MRITPHKMYRAEKRNLMFGRKARGNTKPHERRLIWAIARETVMELSKQKISRRMLGKK